jgi:flagellar assembly protein FliH
MRAPALAAERHTLGQAAAADVEAALRAQEQQRAQAQQALQAQAAQEELARRQAEAAAREAQLEQAERERQLLEARRQEAARRGHEEGYAEGQRAALEAQAQAASRLQTMLDELEGGLTAYLADAEDMAVQLAFAAICRLLGEAYATPAGVRAHVAQALASQRRHGALRVRLHPHDLALLAPAEGGTLAWQADPSLTMGGCVVEGAAGELEARLEAQLAWIKETLAAVRRDCAAEDEPW